MEFNTLAKEIWKLKYFSDNDNSIEDVIRRTSKCIASVEKEKDFWEEKFYEMITSGKFIPGGRILNGAGTSNNYLLNCAVLDVGDSMSEIMETQRRAAIMFQCNYGVGYNFSKIRPKGTKIKRGGEASGPVSFMNGFNAWGKVIQTGGGRRAAQIAILNCWHADIFEFIDAKRKEGDLDQFNISVGITDDFIEAVKSKSTWNLGYYNDEGEFIIIKTVKAVDLWKKIVEAGFYYNDPGLFFIDRINRYNNYWYLYDIQAANPCLTKDTLVAVKTNLSSLEIKNIRIDELAERCKNNESFYIFNGSSWEKNSFFRKTAENQKIIRLVISIDSQENEIKCTEYHKFLKYISEGIYEKVEVKDLKEGDIIKGVLGNGLIKYKYYLDNLEDVYCTTTTTNLFMLSNGILSGNCGELPLPPNGVCCLGNINLTSFISNPFSDNVSFDYDSYKETIKNAVRFLDNVLDVSDYPFPEIKERVISDRRIGLNGVAGLGSALSMLKKPYDSQEALKWVEKICEIWRNVAYESSIELAKERGSFKNFKSKEYVSGNFIKTLPSELIDSIEKFGIRNGALMTVPPVGTGSLIVNNISNGIEPIFALEYKRNIRDHKNSEIKTELVEDYAWGMYKKLNNIKEDTKVNEKPEYFKTSMQISPKSHIDMQAIVQKYCDGSISKTCNLPKDFTIKEYEDLMFYALDSGCKGFTTFREGSREAVLFVEDKNRNQEKEKRSEEKIKVAEPKKKRPRILLGKTYKISDDKGNLYVTINDIEEKGKRKPYEIFINSNGENSEYMPWYRAISKLISAVMRRADDISFLVKDLKQIYGENGYWSDGRYIQSQPQMVGLIIEEHLKELNPDFIDETKYLKCPSCGEMSYVKEGGCGKCLSCSFSSCG